jgi:uncharacterized protein involved in outer membrane biogenesis
VETAPLMWTGEPKPTGPGPSRAGVREIAPWLGAAVGLSVLGYGLLSVALSLVIQPQDLRTGAERWTSAALHRPVTIGRISLRVFPRPAVTAYRVEVGNTPGFAGPPLMVAEALRTRVSVRALARRRLLLVDPTAEGLVVHLAIDSAGRRSFGDLVPDGPSSSRKPPFGVSWDRLRVDRPRIDFHDERSGQRWALTSDRVSVSRLLTMRKEVRLYVSGGPLSASGSSWGETNPLRVAKAAVELRADASWPPTWTELDNGMLELSGVRLRGNGMVGRMNDDTGQVRLEVTVDASAEPELSLWMEGALGDDAFPVTVLVDRRRSEGDLISYGSAESFAELLALLDMLVALAGARTAS